MPQLFYSFSQEMEKCWKRELFLKGEKRRSREKGEYKIQRVRENTKNKRVYSRLTETCLSPEKSENYVPGSRELLFTAEKCKERK